jgi:hypothetical protein
LAGLGEGRPSWTQQNEPSSKIATAVDFVLSGQIVKVDVLHSAKTVTLVGPALRHPP